MSAVTSGLARSMTYVVERVQTHQMPLGHDPFRASLMCGETHQRESKAPKTGYTIYEIRCIRSYLGGHGMQHNFPSYVALEHKR
jgi:hypothetical protein